MECPWCKAYRNWIVQFESENQHTDETDLDHEKQRLGLVPNKFWGYPTGFLSSIENIRDEYAVLNKNVKDKFSVLPRGQINMKTGEMTVGRIVIDISKYRDIVMGEVLEHLWVQSSFACSMSCITPLCDEMARASHSMEVLEWESSKKVPMNEEFKLLIPLSEKVLLKYQKEEFPDYYEGREEMKPTFMKKGKVI